MCCGSYTYTYTYTNANPHTDTDSNTDSNSNTECDSDANTDSYTERNFYTNTRPAITGYRSWSHQWRKHSMEFNNSNRYFYCHVFVICGSKKESPLTQVFLKISK